MSFATALPWRVITISSPGLPRDLLDLAAPAAPKTVKPLPSLAEFRQGIGHAGTPAVQLLRERNAMADESGYSRHRRF